MVARGELGGDRQRLEQAGLGRGGAAAHQLEDVGVALLRHDRGAGGHRLGQGDEAELAAAPQHQVRRQPSEVLQCQGDLEQHLRLGLAARQLHRGHRFLHGREAEAAASGLAVDRQQRHTVAGRRAERVLVDAAQAGAEPQGVVAQLGRESSGPQRHRAGHRGLMVGVAGQRRRRLARRQLVERGGDGARALGERGHLVAQVEAQRRQHLVVARAAEVEARARFADRRGEAALERGVDVLVAELDLPVAGGMGGGERGQPVANRRDQGCGQQPNLAEHLGMGDRSAHVVRHQASVEPVILAGGVAQHPLVERPAPRPLPQPAHRRTAAAAVAACSPAACSSAKLPTRRE